MRRKKISSSQLPLADQTSFWRLWGLIDHENWEHIRCGIVRQIRYTIAKSLYTGIAVNLVFRVEKYSSGGKLNLE
jgi:hypothetical protein